jgi:hypothetical protein
MEAASLESFATPTWARIIATEFFLKQLVSMHDANTAFDMGFGRETASTLTHRFEKRNQQGYHRA